jgi:hypothetical protein
MKLLILISGFVFFSVACNPAKNDLSGSNELRGTVYINDTINGFEGEVASKNLKILLKKPEDSNSLNFLYSAQTDSFGNVRFTNLSPIPYNVYSTIDQNGLKFTFDSTIKSTDPITTFKAVLYPDFTTYNLLSIFTKDKNGNLLPNVKVCIFTSGLLASKNECEGSSITLTTDKFGKAYTTKLPVGKYYLNARDSVGSQIDIKVKDSVDIPSTKGYCPKSLTLQ